MKVPSGSAFALSTPALERKIRQRKRPVQERSQVTVEAILEATLQVLTQRGTAALNTTTVAERAGVSVGTLYQYFPDKKALVAALSVRMLTRMHEAIEAASGALAGLERKDALRKLVVTLVAFKRDNLQSVRALRESMAGMEGTALVRDVTQAMLGLVETMVRDALAARVLVAALEGAMSAAIDEEPELLRDEAFIERLVVMAQSFE